MRLVFVQEGSSGKVQRSRSGMRGDRLLLADEQPTLPSNPLPFGDASSPWNRIQSSASGFLGLAQGSF